MSRDTFAKPSLPLVSFGDTVPYPQGCHVLLEWPPNMHFFNTLESRCPEFIWIDVDFPISKTSLK
jgi:hypothetical protein